MKLPVDSLKKDPRKLKEFLSSNRSTRELLAVLKRLGKLEKGFDKNVLINLLGHHNSKVRLWAIKNLGKLKDVSLFPLFKEIVLKDSDTAVRREAVSAIGRLRNKSTIEFLFSLLEDKDPEVVSQAIRGLLVFKGNKNVDMVLKRLIHHENEIIRDIIAVEYFQDKGSSTNLKVNAERFCNIAVNGDVIDVLRMLPDNVVDLTFTSPPYYNAKNYSKYKSYEAYLDFLVEVFKEVHRITKEGRFFVLNTSPVIIPRVGRKYKSRRYAIPFDIHSRLVEVGWEFIDDIIWIKPSGSAKNRIGGFLQHRKPLTYKPNPVVEYIMVYRKRTTKLIDWNIRQYDEETIEKSKVRGEVDRTNVWYINPDSDPLHEAVFPEELCQKVIKYYSFVGDLILDPFAGRGTLGKVALDMQRKFFLVEKNEKYFSYMREFVTKEQLVLEKEFPKFMTYEEFKEYVSELRSKCS